MKKFILCIGCIILFLGGGYRCSKPEPVSSFLEDSLVIDTLRKFDKSEIMYIHYDECVNVYSGDTFLFKLCFDDILDKRCSVCMETVDCMEPTYATINLKIYDPQNSLLGIASPKIRGCYGSPNSSCEGADTLLGFGFCIYKLSPLLQRADLKKEYSIKLKISP